MLTRLAPLALVLAGCDAQSQCQSHFTGQQGEISACIDGAGIGSKLVTSFKSAGLNGGGSYSQAREICGSRCSGAYPSDSAASTACTDSCQAQVAYLLQNPSG